MQLHRTQQQHGDAAAASRHSVALAATAAQLLGKNAHIVVSGKWDKGRAGLLRNGSQNLLAARRAKEYIGHVA